MIEDFKHMKWLPLAGGALLCVLGLTALVWPGRVAKILPLCIGAAILGLGLCEVASGFLFTIRTPYGYNIIVKYLIAF